MLKKQTKKIFLLLFMCLFFPSYGKAATWYVRTDGGSLSQCTGLADAPYPGSGSAQPCAVNHLFWLLSAKDQTTVISGGDTIIIGPGSYMMGINQAGDQAPNTGSGSCAAGAGTFTCMMPAIPSGLDADHPTTIIGKNWDTKITPAPELWGAGRVSHIINLTNSNNIVLRYLDITDRAQCGYNFTGSPMKCDRTTVPYGYQADYGIYAKDSSNVLLKDIDLHGLSQGGLNGGRLTDWTFDHVNMIANAFDGWNGDVGHGSYGSGNDSSMHGTIMIKNSKINYNGCIENYPLTGVYPDVAVGGCYSPHHNGYGDGLGMYFTEGDWVIEDTEIMHNTEDGLDLLYHTGQTGIIKLNRVRAEGNAGQQLKFGANANIENSVIIGNCNFFANNPLAGGDGLATDNCRAGSTAITTSGWRSGHYLTIANSTLVAPTLNIIEVGPNSTSTNAAGSKNVTGSLSSITGDNQYAVSQEQDTMWIRWSGNYDPNLGLVIPQWNSNSTKTILTGIWISDGNGIYHMTGIGAQTGNNYAFDMVYKSYVCDGTEKVVSRNNIFLGMASWASSTQAIVPGKHPNLLYLDGTDGNGSGTCAAINPVTMDNKDGIAYNLQTNECSDSNNVLCLNPKLSSTLPPLDGYSDIYTYGERWDVVPEPDSLVIDKSSSVVGSSLLASAVVPSIDILGNPRPSGSGIDWGAYELIKKTYDISDYISLLSNWYHIGTVSDVNLDNRVNVRDLGMIMSNWK